ncbi:DEAD/DEAH box helicase [Paraflavitalea sp. CAU 1676]|uniref:DEAD/DEAH box helicase n=1 Tax=Paraflavitalea sp. CAU 1676 TaxID=3032598 RepID=UPI0023DC4FE2|nr:DEAD/DEAH box helicase [Paraflavitalea sp. CAU 1676]MDF2191854.1 DEAD/DEAH box helicase [Paraflavitalea sp. CAU 1676]
MDQAAHHTATPPGADARFKRFIIDQLNDTAIAQRSPGANYIEPREYQLISPHSLEPDHGIFINRLAYPIFPPVTVLRQDQQLLISCTCNPDDQKLCTHEAQVLTALLRRDDLGAFFFPQVRLEKLKKFAADYGLATVDNLDDFFSIQYENNKLTITATQASLLAVNPDSLQALQQLLYPATDELPASVPQAEGKTTIIVLKQHKYHKHLLVELYSAGQSKDGKIKNPLTPLAPLDLAWTLDDPDHLKFYTAIHKFQIHPAAKRSTSDLKALKAIIRNPARYRFYLHHPEVSENVTATSVTPVRTALLPGGINISVSQEGAFYTVHGKLQLSDRELSLKDAQLRFNWFLQADNTLYLIDQLPALGMIELLKKRDHFLIHSNKYSEFKTQLLEKLEDKLDIDYQYIPEATPADMARTPNGNKLERIIYLSDLKNFVMIIPVIRYGEVEIPIRTKRLVHTTDAKGKDVLIPRNDDAERAFTALILSQHPHFDEQQENDLHYWYLHRDRFLSEDWFLQAFEVWEKEGITVLGFNELDNNRVNPHRVKVDIKVLTGINWFNADIRVKFGKQKASLKQVYKSIRNHNKYVQLGDGTQGILPEEWIKKFTDYFNNAEVIDESTIRINKINLSAVEQLYEAALPDEAIEMEIQAYREKLSGVQDIKAVEEPVELHGILRPYQREGLNWLNFLDELNFGGCLADDMGLGKSIQIIAFILSQRHKVKHNTNLLVVPSTLIFNWQQEVERFAPSIKICTVHGAGRIKNTESFEEYELILTSYGTLLSDISFLKDYTFNYVFLDESQNIKNPETQRYKSVRLLNARNRIAITGTPIENNTFDLFSQLSFACPGLLGSKQYFKDVFSVPIDSFKNSKRAIELHQKVKPFILRRTKDEVAPELPDKTEMVVYCEMDEEQRGIYDAYEKEFREYISATTDDQLKKNPMNVLKGLTRLRQICDAPALLGDDALTGHSSAKINTLLEQIEDKSPNHKILVFSQFVTMLDLIAEQLKKRDIGYEMLTGSTRNRGAVVNAFQTNPNSRVFLISLKAGGTGLNLTEADYVYLIDPWWNPAVENQAIDRAHRIGQDKKVIAIRLICADTVEEKIMQMQETKQSLADDLIKTGNALVPALSKQELLQLLSFQPA